MGTPLGEVVALHRTPSRRAPLVAIDEATFLTDVGIEGDRHGRPGSGRQVVLTQWEVLDGLGLTPGSTREQVTIRGLASIRAGDVLALGPTGAVRLEIAQPRVPCAVMDGIRPGLRRELLGQGGWCARVLGGGTVRRGDRVEILSAALGDDPLDPELLALRAAVTAWEESPRVKDGWGRREQLAQHVEWNHLGATTIVAGDGGPAGAVPDGNLDAFNAAAVARHAADDESRLWADHDIALTALVDAARAGSAVGGAAARTAREWVRSAAALYREHTCR